MLGTVLIKNYNPPKYDVKEILRYAGVKGDLPQIDALIKECIEEASDKLTYKVCFANFPLSLLRDEVDLGFATVTSKHLSKNLRGCSEVIVFAATVGIGIDRLIAKYGALSPVKALIFQALGAERIESLCNAFNDDVIRRYSFVKPRFSAGYGDLPLDFQHQIFNVLSCNKNVGITLNESLIMSPSKSVTGIIGIAHGTDLTKEDDCKKCDKTDCQFRR